MMYINRQDKILGYSEAMDFAKEKWGDKVIAIGKNRDLYKIARIAKLNTEKKYQVEELSYVGETWNWYDNRTGEIFELGDLEDVGIQPYVMYDGMCYKEVNTDDWYVLLDSTNCSVHKRLSKEELKELMEKENYFD